MKNPDQMQTLGEEMLKQMCEGAGSFNRWREDNPIEPLLQDDDAICFGHEPRDILSCRKLDGINLSGLRFAAWDFSNAHLWKADFTGSFFNECTFDEAYLVQSKWSGAHIQHTTFKSAKASRSDFSGARFKHCKIIHTDFERSDLSDVDLSYEVADGVGNHNVVYRSDFSESNLSRAILSGSDFIRSSFYRVNFSNADCSDACFFRTTFKECDFRAANCSDASFYRATFKQNKYSETNFQSSDLRGIDLSQEDIPGEMLQGALVR